MEENGASNKGGHPIDHFQQLRELARAIRLHAVRMTGRAGASHVGSCLSIAEILAVLYGRVLRVDPARPDWPERDRMIVSKGHAAAAVYSVLAECRFFPVQWLQSFYTDGARLAGHVTHWGVPGVEISTGSLGHGLPIAAGMALSAKLDAESHRVFVILSDGECDEGSVWEAAMFAGHHKLDNLLVIVDYNKIQSLDRVCNVLDLEPFADKWRAFGWDTAAVDGHDVEQISGAFDSMLQRSGKPSCLIAHTIKGKGVSFMEDSVLWHYRSPRGEEFDLAIAELEAAG